jgi:hypothetical protein
MLLGKFCRLLCDYLWIYATSVGLGNEYNEWNHYNHNHLQSYIWLYCLGRSTFGLVFHSRFISKPIERHHLVEVEDVLGRLLKYTYRFTTDAYFHYILVVSPLDIDVVAELFLRSYFISQGKDPQIKFVAFDRELTFAVNKLLLTFEFIQSSLLPDTPNYAVVR